MPDKKSFIILIILIICSSFIYSQNNKRTHPATPVGIKIPPVKSRAGLPDQTVHIKGLKAVMLGGEVDGVNGQGTKNYLNYLRKISKTLKARGVQVREFYKPTNMTAIRKALKGAHFVAYAGHGIGSLKPPKYHTPNPGGMLILKQVWISGEQIRNEFKTHPGAIVILLGACFTAGNAGPDIGKIGEEEARQRIVSYTTPFMNGNFAGYYAAWSPYTGQAVLAHLFAGKNMGQAYAHSNLDKVRKINHPGSKGKKIWYHITKRGQKPVFDYAFSGNPDLTLKDLFASNTTDTDPGIEEPVNPDTIQKFSPKQSRLLRKAVIKGNDSAAFNALENKANPNYTKNKWSVLALAVYYNRVNVAARLVKNMADVNFKVDGWSLLSLAEAYKRKEIYELLKQGGATKSRSIKRAINIPKGE